MPTKTTGVEPYTIFYVHLNPTLSAEMLPDPLIRSQLIGMVRLLSNAYFLPGAKAPPPPGYTSPETARSPEVSWVTEEFKHWNWLLMHAWALHKEWKLRFEKHDPDIEESLKYMNGHLPLSWMSGREFWDPPLMRGIEVSRIRGAAFNNREWIRASRQLHNWTKRLPPLWLVDLRTASVAVEKLISDAELVLKEPDRLRPEGIKEKDWNHIKKQATRIVNGEDVEDDDERIDDLIEKVDLAFVNIGKLRPAGINDAEWAVIQKIASEKVNGRDPLEEPKDWNYTNYVG